MEVLPVRYTSGIECLPRSLESTILTFIVSWHMIDGIRITSPSFPQLLQLSHLPHFPPRKYFVARDRGIDYLTEPCVCSTVLQGIRQFEYYGTRIEYHIVQAGSMVWAKPVWWYYIMAISISFQAICPTRHKVASVAIELIDIRKNEVHILGDLMALIYIMFSILFTCMWGTWVVKCLHGAYLWLVASGY